MGDGHSIGSPNSTNTFASNDANLILFAPTPSPNTNTLSDNRPGYTQVEAELYVAYHPQGYAPGGGAQNGPFDYHPTDAYNATPEREAWAGPNA